MKKRIYTHSYNYALQNAKALWLLAALFVWSPGWAQQQPRKTDMRGAQQSPSHKVLNEEVLRQQQTKPIILDSSPDISVTDGNDVYYVKRSGNTSIAATSSVCVYNATTKSTEDIIQTNAATVGYNPKNVVENLLLDKTGSLLYFSTSLVNRKGYTEFLTWRYDIKARRLAAYKDGKILSVDELGNQTIVFEGVSSNGPFTKTWIMAPDGKMISTSMTQNPKSVE